MFIQFLSLFTFSMSFAINGPSTIGVETQISEAIKHQVRLECPTCQVEITLHNKLLIEDIAKPDAVIADHWRGQTNLLLKLGDQHRVITATIRWKDKVVVANKNIKQGKSIGKDDVRVVEKDVTFLKEAYVQEVGDVLGWEGKRIFQRGQVIDEGQLRKPIVVKYGQPIKLRLQEGSLSLQMTGHARGAGAVGDRIPVLISKTRTKVFAKIIDKNLAEVE